MSDYQPIIDVTPIEHSREQKSAGSKASSAWQSSQSPSWNASAGRFSSTNAGPIPPFGAAYAQGPTASAASKGGGSALGGLVRIIAGTGLVLIGIPMLILPGPGLLSIAAGAMLMASGSRRLFGAR